MLGRNQLSRLLQILWRIQSGRYPSVRELASHCEVSRRTVFRDLIALENGGFPIRYDEGRQGYFLESRFHLQAPGIEREEAAALLILAHQWGGSDSLGLAKHAQSGAVKLLHTLPKDVVDRVKLTADPLLQAGPIVARNQDRAEIYDKLLESLLQRNQIRVWYREPDRLELDATKLSPYRMLLARTMWCVVGRSSAHGSVKLFRVPYIQRVLLTEDPYSIPPRFSMERFLAQAWSVDPGARRHEIWLRFEARIAPEIQDLSWHRSQRLELLSDGRIDMRLSIDGLDEILRWILGFGDDVEILAPPELRDRVRDVAHRVARIHSPIGIASVGVSSS